MMAKPMKTLELLYAVIQNYLTVFRRLHDRKTEHFKGITSSCHASAIADHVTSTGHNSKWDHFEI